MICKNCGETNADTASFCRKCGHKLVQQCMDVNSEDMGITQELKGNLKSGQQPDLKAEVGPSSGKKKSKIGIIIFGIVLLCVVAGSSVFFINKQAKVKEYTNQMEKGDKYLAEMDYENAEATYLDAIHVNPKEEKAYIALADVYVEQEKYDDAIQILEQAQAEIESETVQQKAQEIIEVKEKKDEEIKAEEEKIKAQENAAKLYEEYLNTVLIPEYGVGTVGEIDVADGRMDIENSWEDKLCGLYSVLYTDMDYDGIDEMITTFVTKEPSVQTGGERFILNVEVFGIDNSAVVEISSQGRQTNKIILQRDGNTSVFVKEENSKKYIVILTASQYRFEEFTFDFNIYSMTDKKIVCLKGLRCFSEGLLYDTTAIEGTIEEQSDIYKRKGALILESPGKELDKTVKMAEILPELEKEVESIFKVGSWISSEYMPESHSADGLPSYFGFAVSEKMEGVTDIFRIQSISVTPPYTKFTFDYTGFQSKTQ